MEKTRISTSSTLESPLKTVDSLSEHDLQLERQAVRKLDYTILPIVTLFFLASYMVCFFSLSLSKKMAFVSNHFILQDRTNIGNKNSVATRDKGLKSVYRKCSSCRPPKGSPID